VHYDYEKNCYCADALKDAVIKWYYENNKTKWIERKKWRNK
jgi:hypothetical protein